MYVHFHVVFFCALKTARVMGGGGKAATELPDHRPAVSLSSIPFDRDSCTESHVGHTPCGRSRRSRCSNAARPVGCVRHGGPRDTATSSRCVIRPRWISLLLVLFSSHTQHVRCGSTRSVPTIALFGVPQGSVLGRSCSSYTRLTRLNSYDWWKVTACPRTCMPTTLGSIGLVGLTDRTAPGTCFVLQC